MLLYKANVICVSGNLIVSRELEFGRAFHEAIGRSCGEQNNLFHLRAISATQSTSSNIFL
jgi:hypothetical protein